MSPGDRIELLKRSVRQAEQLAGWLERSHGATAGVDPSNIIANEYADDDLPPLFRAIRERVPGLLDTVRRTADYTARYSRESS